jgi:hypothetical protein
MTSLTHCVRPSLIARENTYTLTDEALTSNDDGKIVSLPYDQIERLELVTFAGAGGKQGQLSIKSRSGITHKIRSHHYQSLGLFENRTDTYAPFARELS